jgi:hypothetical protein
VEHETTAWKKLGVEISSQHLLLPSGSIHSSLACHLYNPTYYVRDPECQINDDKTSPTIYLLHGSGFSSDNSFIFDQVCRRDETKDVLWFYSEDILRPHRDFVCEIRKNMSAIVEICFGVDVWNEGEKVC